MGIRKVKHGRDSVLCYKLRPLLKYKSKYNFIKENLNHLSVL